LKSLKQALIVQLSRWMLVTDAASVLRLCSGQ
jgi:hypothetical protein